MLWRYVGVTLVALGGAMLIAPEAEDEAAIASRAAPEPQAPDSVRAGGGRETGMPEGATLASAAETEALLPAALDLGSAPAAQAPAGAGPADVPRVARLDPAPSDGAARPGEQPAAPPRVDVEAASALVPEELPSLQRPASLRPAEITAETLALIETAEDGQAPASEAADAAGNEMLYVSGSRVNVRSGPSTSYAVIGSTVYGEAVELLAFENDSWAWVRFGDDRLGYMARSFLAPDPGDG